MASINSNSITRTRVTQGGRIVIPAEIRKEVGIDIGDTVNISRSGDILSISSSKAALRRLQKSLLGAAKPGTSIVDELIAERRKEAENER